MADVATEREVYIEFLELYKDLTCLWDSSCKLYSNRDARNQALQILLEKLKKIEKDSSIATVKKKIENMRSAYKRELKKMQQSKSTGAGVGDIYVPTLWYFEYLTFLDDKDAVNRSGVDTIITSDDENEVSETQTKICRQPASKRRATNLMKKQEQLIESAQNLLSTEGDPAECYGRAIGLQLKEMTKIQRCIVEKLISEVVFYGKLDKLSLQSSITLNNSGYYHPVSTPSPSSSVSYYPVPTPSPSSVSYHPVPTPSPSSSVSYHSYNSPVISQIQSPVHSSSTLIPNIVTMLTPNNSIQNTNQETIHQQSSSYNMLQNTTYEGDNNAIKEFLIMRK